MTGAPRLDLHRRAVLGFLRHRRGPRAAFPSSSARTSSAWTGQSVIDNGRIEISPELDRRIDIFLRYYDGYGAIIVQMNVEDTRNGVAEYVIEKYGDKVIIELKWGQGAKCIGGEIQVNNLEYARFLKNRGYIVDPDPNDPGRGGRLPAGRDQRVCPPQPAG